MWRLIFWFVVVMALAWGLTWLASHPGHISIDWFGWRLENIPVALALAVLLIVLLVGWAALRLLRWIVGAPFAVTDLFRRNRRRKALQELTHGFTALLAGDAASAGKAARRAVRLAPEEPMARLLEAHSALAAGDARAAHHYLARLRKDPHMEPAALYGLFELAQKENNVDAARAVAEVALRKYPNLSWAAEAVLKFAALSGEWERVRALLTRMRKAKLIDRTAEKRMLAAAFTAEAQTLEEQDPARALQLALQAHKLDPALVPAAVIAGRLLAAQGKVRRAAKVLEKTWKHSPHPDIAEVYAHLRHGDSPRDRLVRVRQLLRTAAGGEEGAVALARAAIDAHDWETALGALRPWLNENPSARIFLLMAELEEARGGDVGRMREWLRRARTARPDPAWVADGVVSPVWLPVTPDGRLGAFAWREPPLSPSAQMLHEPVPEEWLRPAVAVEEAPQALPVEVVEVQESQEPAESAAEETATEETSAPAPEAPAKEPVATEIVEQPAPMAPRQPVVEPSSAPPPQPLPGAEAAVEVPEEPPHRPPLPDDPGLPPKRQ